LPLIPQRFIADRLGGFQIETTSEHGQAAKYHPLLL
jgi:hypothetical protein